jgi:NHS family xanthosine MFS transporter
MSFLQFFVWGAWLITFGSYWFNEDIHSIEVWTPQMFGAIFSTLGLSSLFMPALTGIIADRWIRAERLYGVLHLLGACALFYIPALEKPEEYFWVIFVAMVCYMPTISLSNAVAYRVLTANNYDVIKVFPPIRVWGTVGFIAAMWTTNLLGFKTNTSQFYVAAVAAVVLGLYSFTLPACKPEHKVEKGESIWSMLGFDAFKLLAQYKMFLFFFFSMLLGAALQLTNMYGDQFLDGYKYMDEYKDSFVVKYSTIIMSISQISETLFILAIPFFLKRFGIKQVMLISMFAWVLRFGLFAFGDPGPGLWMIILSCIVYGMAFDFFNISGSLFVETSVKPNIRSSAQGLFMMVTNGIGAVLGSYGSGVIIQKYFLDADGNRMWSGIWITFALYALVVGVLFAVLFRHKHEPEKLGGVSH